MSDTALTGIHPRRADGVTAPLNEDWLAVVLGLAIFVLCARGAGQCRSDRLGGHDVGLGHDLVRRSRRPRRLTAGSAASARWSPLMSRCSSCSAPAAAALGSDVRRFALAFTAVFWIAYASWIVGNFAHFAAVTPADQQKFGISWSLKLTNEGGYIVALIAGLIIANFFPRFAEVAEGGDPAGALHQDRHRHSRRLLRGDRGGQAQPRHLADAARRRRDRRGLSDLLGGGLLRRPQMVRLQPRMGGAARLRHFDLRRRRRRSPSAARSAPGRSVPVLVSSLVVIFAVVEVLILPFLAQTFLVARAAGRRRLDGACGQDRRRGGRGRRHHRVADSGQGGRRRRALSARLDSRHRRRRSRCSSTSSSASGRSCSATSGPTTSTSRRSRTRPRRGEIWQRFPKFIIGFVMTFVGRALSRARHAGGIVAKARRRDRRGQHVPRHLLHPDLLLDRRAVELHASCGRRASASSPRSIWSQPVRLRHLGRPADLVAVLRRRQAAARRLDCRTRNDASCRETRICATNCATPPSSRCCRSRRS